MEGVAPSRCPSCKYEMDAATSVDGTDIRPNPGDVSVCFNCGEYMAFGEGGVLHRMTNDEFNAALASDRDAVEQMVVAARLIVQRGPLDG